MALALKNQDSKEALEDVAFKPIREGFLMKRGAHPEDVYLKRWVTLWPSRIGYTMKLSSGKYCNFIPLEYITEVQPATDWTDDPEQQGDFIIKVVNGDEDPLKPRKAGGMDEMFSCLHDHTYDGVVADDIARHHPRPYFLRASDVIERNMWMRVIRKAARIHKKSMQKERDMPNWRKLQIVARKYYEGSLVQTFASFLILSNFFINAFEAQVNPEPGGYIESVLNSLDYFFTIIFTVELIWNAFSSWFSKFWSSAWNIFDTGIIAVSIAGLAGGMPQGLTVLRALRAVRVFRLFRRLDPLKQILISLGYAVKPVSSAALFVLLFSSLYSVIGVTFFAEDFPDFFGDFLRAQLTLLQIMTFDGWIDSITRGMLDEYRAKTERGEMSRNRMLQFQAGTAFYAVSYCLVGGLVLMNVVMAILVEAFTEAKEQVAVDKVKMAAIDLLMAPVSEPLEGLIKEWASIEDDYSREQAIESVFQRMDVNQDRSLSLPELQEDLWSLGSEPRNQLSDEDFERYTNERAVCNRHGSLGKVGFKEMVKSLLHDYENNQGAWAHTTINLWDGTFWDMIGANEQIKQKDGFFYTLHKCWNGDDDDDDDDPSDAVGFSAKHRRLSQIEEEEEDIIQKVSEGKVDRETTRDGGRAFWT